MPKTTLPEKWFQYASNQHTSRFEIPPVAPHADVGKLPADTAVKGDGPGGLRSLDLRLSSPLQERRFRRPPRYPDYATGPISMLNNKAPYINEIVIMNLVCLPIAYNRCSKPCDKCSATIKSHLSTVSMKNSNLSNSATALGAARRLDTFLALMRI